MRRHCEEGEARRGNLIEFVAVSRDCRVAALLAMTLVFFDGAALRRPRNDNGANEELFASGF